MNQEEKEEKEEKNEDSPRTIMQNTVIIPLTQSIIEAILGGEIQLRSMLPPEESEEEEQSLRRHRYWLEDDEEPPEPKRLRFSPSEINYFFTLSSGEEFYYTEEDSKPTLINESIEPNPMVRMIIGNLPIGIKNRLNYLAKFRFDEMEEQESDIEEDEDGEIITRYKPKQFHNVCMQVFSAYMREMKLRAAFRRLWALWKTYRLHKVSCEDVDPITLSEPINKVVLYEKHKKITTKKN
jgi:hypothetical protein